jgi:hypothetical protein
MIGHDSCERNAQALVQLVRDDRDREIEAMAGAARARADALLREAHAQARHLMRRAFAEERQRRDERIHAAAARLATSRRHWRQRRSAEALEHGWQSLHEALSRRWADPQARALWIAGVVAAARGSLGTEPMTVAHAADLTEDERLALARDLAPDLVADPRIGAGLRITAGANVVDGTVEGLLADPIEIGARLLQSWQRP